MSESASFQSHELLDSRFWWRLFHGAIFVAVLSFAIGIFGHIFAHSLAMGDYSESSAFRRIDIGTNKLLVPENTIRFGQQRKDGPQDRLDLFLKWPEMTGYTAAHRDSFTFQSKSMSLIFLSFSEQIMSRDMSGRFEPIYRSLIVRPGTTGPAGLTVYQFKKETGYRGETLVTGDDKGGHIFVARCLENANLLTACERDIIVGDGLSLTYRFPRQMLDQWRAIDRAVTTYANDLIETATKNNPGGE